MNPYFQTIKVRIATMRTVLVGGLIVPAFVLSLGVEADAQTLADALAKAYGTNPVLQAARATLRATDEGTAQALAGWRPSVSAIGTAASKSSATSTTRTSSFSQPRTVTLSVTQSLYAGGQTQADILSAEHAVQAQKARLAGTEQQVLLAAATAYLNVLRDQAVLKLNVQNEHILARHLEATRDRFNVGEITRTDVHQGEARLAGATANRIEAEGTLAISRATYVNVVGEAPGHLDQPHLALALPQSLSKALTLAEKNNPAVLAAIFDEKVTQDAISGVQGQLRPSLDLSGSANRSTDTVSRHDGSNSLEAKLTLTVPLYQSGSVYSQLRQARQTASASRLTTDQSRRDATEHVRQAWYNLEAARARIESIKIQVQAAQTALEGIQQEASVGSRTVLDVLDAEQESLDARVNLVKSQRDKTTAALTLMSAIGTLTAVDLNLAVDLYDADRHYHDVRGKWFGGDAGGNVN